MLLEITLAMGVCATLASSIAAVTSVLTYNESHMSRERNSRNEVGIKIDKEFLKEETQKSKKVHRKEFIEIDKSSMKQMSEQETDITHVDNATSAEIAKAAGYLAPSDKIDKALKFANGIIAMGAKHSHNDSDTEEEIEQHSPSDKVFVKEPGNKIVYRHNESKQLPIQHTQTLLLRWPNLSRLEIRNYEIQFAT